jgi:hypothetical protein
MFLTFSSDVQSVFVKSVSLSEKLSGSQTGSQFTLGTKQIASFLSPILDLSTEGMI